MLRFGGENHRIDFQDLVGESVWLYPQTEVFVDLAVRRKIDGGDVRYGVSDTAVDVTGSTPVVTVTVTVTGSDRRPMTITADLVVGADGSHSMGRRSFPPGICTEWFREYPFVWLGFLVEAPQSHPELIYTQSEDGFALLSHRTPDVQRVYLQCATGDIAEQWSDDRIWSEMVKRLNGNGFEVQQGPIRDKTILPLPLAHPWSEVLFEMSTIRTAFVVVAVVGGHRTASQGTSMTTLPSALRSATCRSAMAVSASANLAPIYGRTAPVANISASSAISRVASSG